MRLLCKEAWRLSVRLWARCTLKHVKTVETLYPTSTCGKSDLKAVTANFAEYVGISGGSFEAFA